MAGKHWLVVALLCAVFGAGCAVKDGKLGFAEPPIQRPAQQVAQEVVDWRGELDALVKEVRDDVATRDASMADEIDRVRQDLNTSVDAIGQSMAKIRDANDITSVLDALEELKTGQPDVDKKLDQFKESQAEELAALRATVEDAANAKDPVEATLAVAKDGGTLIPGPVGVGVSLAGAIGWTIYKRLRDGQLQQVVGGVQQILDGMPDEEAQKAKSVLKRSQSVATRRAVENAQARI